MQKFYSNMDNDIIRLDDYRIHENPAFDYAAYEKRASSRCRRAAFRAYGAVIAETAVTLAIGICAVICACAFISIL